MAVFELQMRQDNSRVLSRWEIHSDARCDHGTLSAIHFQEVSISTFLLLTVDRNERREALLGSSVIG
jgi:hypothetical protein